MPNQWEFIIQDGKLIKRKKADLERREISPQSHPPAKGPRGVFYRAAKFLIIFAVIIGLLSGLTVSVVKLASKYALLEIFLTTTLPPPSLKSANILILGLDAVFGHRSDTIIVVHIENNPNRVSLVSIPRDTLANIPYHGQDKINHAYAFGGVELSKTAVSELLNIPIPYYVTIDIAGLANAIDELGGITIDVEKRMYYVDYAGNLNVDLKPGIQTLNGRQAVAYVRYRTDGGDLKRILRQQKFLKALADKFTNGGNLIKAPGLFFKLVSNVNTNMSAHEILGLAMIMRAAYEYGNYQMVSLGGADMMQNGIYYMRPDENRTQEVVEKYLTAPKNKNQAEN